MNNGYKAFRIPAERFFLLGGLVGTRVGKLEMKRSEWKSSRLSTALQGAAWGSQDASHAAEATGRRAFSCPSIGRVLSQGGKKRATFVSPARAVPQASAPFHSVSSFRGEGNFFCLLDRICENASCFVA